MAICPADFKPCIDDLCRGGGGCLAMPGEPMLVPCSGCGQFIAIDGSDADTCDREPVEIDVHDEPVAVPSDDLGIDEDEIPF